jgi:NADPH-dependent ferric siderophore reductase
MRTYTPRRYDPESNTLEVWFVLHGEGPAATWAAAAGPGDRAAIGGPGGRFAIDPVAAQWWIGGDESALPAIATLIEGLPETATATVHLEVAGAEAQVALPEHPGIKVTWHHRASAGTGWGEELVAAVRESDLSPGTHVWVGCEAAAVRRIRGHLLNVRRLPRDHVTTRGYWRIGEANHPDHDYGED